MLLTRWSCSNSKWCLVVCLPYPWCLGAWTTTQVLGLHILTWLVDCSVFVFLLHPHSFWIPCVGGGVGWGMLLLTCWNVCVYFSVSDYFQFRCDTCLRWKHLVTIYRISRLCLLQRLAHSLGSVPSREVLLTTMGDHRTVVVAPTLSSPPSSSWRWSISTSLSSPSALSSAARAKTSKTLCISLLPASRWVILPQLPLLELTQCRE